jgi:hypothetical protein
MVQILLIIKTLFQLFPLIIEGIKTIEAAFPHAQQGAAKLDALKGIVQNAYTVGTGTEAAFESIAPGIDAIAKTAVGIFNATGAFSTTAPATPAVTAVSAPDMSDPVTTIG